MRALGALRTTLLAAAMTFPAGPSFSAEPTPLETLCARTPALLDADGVKLRADACAGDSTSQRALARRLRAGEGAERDLRLSRDWQEFAAEAVRAKIRAIRTIKKVEPVKFNPIVARPAAPPAPDLGRKLDERTRAQAILRATGESGIR